MVFSAFPERHPMHAIDKTHHEYLLAELETLDDEWIEVDGKRLKPSQCYHIELDPMHVLFNENCPESLKEKINSLLKRFRYQ